MSSSQDLNIDVIADINIGRVQLTLSTLETNSYVSVWKMVELPLDKLQSMAKAAHEARREQKAKGHR